MGKKMIDVLIIDFVLISSRQSIAYPTYNILMSTYGIH